MTDTSKDLLSPNKPSDLASILSTKIDLSARAGDQIYECLRQAILNVQLVPGASISEAEIGTAFGASRTPVREALMRLREEGLVLTYASRGSFVSPLSRQRILGAQFLREALEIANVKRLCEVGVTKGRQAEINKNLEKQVDATEREEHLEFHRLDDEFHLLLARATGLDRVEVVLKREKLPLDRLRALSLRVEGHLASLTKAHQEIYEAVLRRDLPVSVERTRAHCRTVLDVLEDLSVRNQNFFSD